MEENDDLLDPSFKDSKQVQSSEDELPNATATLVLGIISIVGCFLYAIPGVVCGIIGLSLHGKDKKLYQENPDKYKISYKNAKAGYICSVIGLSLSAVYFVVILFVFAAAFTGSRF